MLKRIIIIFCSAIALFCGCKSQRTIALLTDYGWDDPYASAVQGVIVSINPDARILSLTHAAPDYNIREASYLLATAAREFPRGTIFVAIVDPESGSSRKPIILETVDQKYFVGPDNGIFTDVIKSFGCKRAVEVNNVLWFRRGGISNTFYGRDVFAPAAAHLSKGKKMEEAGPAVSEPMQLDRAAAEYKNSSITGEILHRDHYGNLITNIPATVLARSGWRAGMELEFLVNKQAVTAKFAERYNAVGKGEFVLLLNGQGLLELARFMASAGDSLKAMAGDRVQLRLAGSTTSATPSLPTTAARISAPISESMK